MDQGKAMHVAEDKEDNYLDQVEELQLNLREDKLPLLDDFQNGDQNQGLFCS